ncbi:pyruvate phosphate dikinase-like enzyme [Tenacibaculum adriaticum]|uniref:Phosphoenolpyruvate synthase n=1 Tax=Tenacibaculum adriaticum TaxID=413713 RepID=A0A5S5DQG2_9FLAO|nr:PEP/pyruvate-binding domain-containing protein [Tenacibaculum adriaticum]TYP98183.1 pyruvate phosphate dikinase-like enzyme [Tenacibaculum adriaticum]
MHKKILLLILFISCSFLEAQEQSTNQIVNLIKQYKNDLRGPYKSIKWYCKDNTERAPRDPCPDSIGGGIQHASFKESALNLRESNHLFFGEILAAVSHKDFLDKTNNFSRLKQYQIGKYLGSIDDGWILRKGQYYRGAIQSEDEEAWGKTFFEDVLNNNNLLETNYYLIRQAIKDIPHNGDSNVAQLMRSQSKILADEIPSFMDIRIKIHGNPQHSDISLVKNFIKEEATKITSKNKKDLNELVATMEKFYAPLNFAKIKKQLLEINNQNNSLQEINDFLKQDEKNISPSELVEKTSSILTNIRYNILSFKSGKDRLKLLDLSNELENILLIESQNWKTETLHESINKIDVLTCATVGTGLLEIWEYNTVKKIFDETLSKEEITIKNLNSVLSTARSMVEWSASLIKANYQENVNNYVTFEPISYGFIDDRVRNSVALSLGETVSKLGTYVANISNINNDVMSINNQSSIRGLNPGFAYGELVVVDGNPNDIEVNTNKIYIFQKPPSDLKPVAGIMTVSEGNLVSHVQLLARNLGIPNAALSNENLKSLSKFNGQKVFYAVSNKGNVILKSELSMTSEEKNLFSKRERSNNMIEVPVNQIRLDVTKVVNMKDVDANDSGKLCGPKAANLGELKKLFPKQVVEGLIIPFGIFKMHMNKEMPNENKSYWQYLNDTFAKAKILKNKGGTENEIEEYQLKSLEKLHKAILNISLNDDFINDLRSNFKSVFGNSIGYIPVFLRSDTNMEDLKEFTGAGLNLTLFNILEEQKIIEGIKRVWASAYTERSFKWRQKYLLNPENVYPSILIIPSVDVDYSGVMITKGINAGNESDLTVAFSRGAGGAVDGQSAETRLITPNSNILLAPARQPDYIRLPTSGGTKSYTTSFNKPILNDYNIQDIRKLASEIRKKIKSEYSNNQAYDVEFGFKNNKLWLFQIRPFVENKQAKSSDYLNSISPKIDTNKTIELSQKI